MWHAVLSGDWEYNGTFAQAYSGPDCEVTDTGAYSCDTYGNGAKMPSNMTWKMVGTANDWYGCSYSIAIYLWGNGSHKVATSFCL